MARDGLPSRLSPTRIRGTLDKDKDKADLLNNIFVQTTKDSNRPDYMKRLRTYTDNGTSLDYEAGRPGFDSGSYPNKSEHAPRRCTLGKGKNEYLALARDVRRIGRKMEVPCLGESHPTHVKEPTALIEKSRGPSRCEWFKPYSPVSGLTSLKRW
ncbi:hypothetical protein Bbelb_272420 [Branchiostoma belcheri]|nr:hypothetical protein Bbelb_272420 [Branchiostoma belcheri]